MTKVKPFFEIYTRSYPPCRYCKDLKDLLNVYGYDFYEMDINDPQHKKSFDEDGFKTVPQVFIETAEAEGFYAKHIGGYDTTKEFLRRDFLKDHPNRDLIIQEIKDLEYE